MLLEEPQAAVYAWLADAGERWRRQLKVGDTLLVCDVGGGTTDFTLIGVDRGGRRARRCGGSPSAITSWSAATTWTSRWRTSRRRRFRRKGSRARSLAIGLALARLPRAKETLLAPTAPKKHPVTVLGRGSKLIGGTVSVELDREGGSDAARRLLSRVRASATSPRGARASGFREIGLPFESDTAITRHLAAFLAAHGDERHRPIRPTHVLFNGGVFKADALRERLSRSDRRLVRRQPRRSSSKAITTSICAVARGAAYYGAAKQGQGVRIRGGTARSYYVGIETAGLAIPGAARPLRALCVVPFGMEEGTETDVPGDEIGLVVGEPAQFRFFSSAVRKAGPARRPARSLDRRRDRRNRFAGSDAAAGRRYSRMAYVPVRFHSQDHRAGRVRAVVREHDLGQRWKLEFSVREDERSGSRMSN